MTHPPTGPGAAPKDWIPATISGSPSPARSTSRNTRTDWLTNPSSGGISICSGAPPPGGAFPVASKTRRHPSWSRVNTSRYETDPPRRCSMEATTRSSSPSPSRSPDRTHTGSVPTRIRPATVCAAEEGVGGGGSSVSPLPFRHATARTASTAPPTTRTARCYPPVRTRPLGPGLDQSAVQPAQLADLQEPHRQPRSGTGRHPRLPPAVGQGRRHPLRGVLGDHVDHGPDDLDRLRLAPLPPPAAQHRQEQDAGDPAAHRDAHGPLGPHGRLGQAPLELPHVGVEPAADVLDLSHRRSCALAHSTSSLIVRFACSGDTGCRNRALPNTAEATAATRTTPATISSAAHSGMTRSSAAAPAASRNPSTNSPRAAAAPNAAAPWSFAEIPSVTSWRASSTSFLIRRPTSPAIRPTSCPVLSSEDSPFRRRSVSSSIPNPPLSSSRTAFSSAPYTYSRAARYMMTRTPTVVANAPYTGAEPSAMRFAYHAPTPRPSVTARSHAMRRRPGICEPSRNTVRTAFRPAPTTPVPVHRRPARPTRPSDTRASRAARRLWVTSGSTPGTDRVRAVSTSSWSPGLLSKAKPTIDTPSRTSGKKDRKP